MSNLTTNTWKSRIIRIADQSESIITDRYSDATDPNVSSVDERISALTNDPENVILIANGDKFMVIHSLSELGKTFRNPDSKIVCLQGLENSASPFSIEPGPFVEQTTVVTPTFNEIIECNQIGTLRNLGADEEMEFEKKNPFGFTCTPMFIMSPSESKVIMNADSTCPFECILALKRDRVTRMGRESTNTVTPESSQRIYCWLYAVGEGALGKMSLNIDNDDPQLREYSKTRHALCILPAFNAGDPTSPNETSHSTFAQLGATLSNLCESNNNANQLNAMNFNRLAENDAKKKDRVKKVLDDDTMKCFLMAGSSDGETPLAELPPDFVTCINKETVGAFGKALLSHLTQNGLPDSHIHVGTIQALYNGNIVNTDPNIVKDFNPFSFSETKPMQANQVETLMLLHIVDLAGKPKAADEIKGSMAQNIAVPSDFYEMYECVLRYHGIMKLFFTSESILYVSFEKFIRSLKREKQHIRSIFVNDPSICTKILYAAEIRTKLFFKSCIECESREDVDNTLLDYDIIFSDLKLRKFHVELPPVFITQTPTVQTPPNKRKIPGDDKDNENKGKRQVVKNESINPTFALRENEEWAIFTGRDAAELRPNHCGKRMCHKYLTKGYCFIDCPNAASHCPESQFTPEQVKGYTDWLETCRKNGKTA